MCVTASIYAILMLPRTTINIQVIQFKARLRKATQCKAAYNTLAIQNNWSVYHHAQPNEHILFLKVIRDIN
jgi:hypothetical protein